MPLVNLLSDPDYFNSTIVMLVSVFVLTLSGGHSRVP